MEQQVTNKDLALISKIIETKDFITPKRKGIKKEMLEGPGRKLWEYIDDYYEKYHSVPSHDTVNTLLSEAKIKLWQVHEPIDYLSDAIIQRDTFEHLKKLQYDLDGWMNQEKPEDVVSNLHSFLKKQNEKHLADLQIVDAKDVVQEVIDSYKATQLGIMGIKTFCNSMDEMTTGWGKGDLSFFVARSGVGKCHGKGTKILMFDGSIKNVEDVVIGDQLMGPDSKPRNVLSLTRGKEEMFKIKPTKGEEWVCNKAHILSLKASSSIDKNYNSGDLYNITLEEYLKLSKRRQKNLRQWRTGVYFKEKYIPYDPYWAGLWLGDGTCREPNITKDEPELFEYYKEFCSKYGFQHTIHRSKNKTPHVSFITNKQINPLYGFIKSFQKNGEKRIREDYLINSEENRLRLLAGLIDTDGHLINNCYEIITKYKGLNDDILYLARSLGLAATSRVKKVTLEERDFTGTYYRIFISGDIDKIPCKILRKKAKPRKQIKDTLVTGFSVDSIGLGNYYGFSVDRDHLYLLGDFTVTHNSWSLVLVTHAALKQGKKVLLISGEMTTKDMIYRHLAIEYKIPYSPFRKAKLDDFNLKKLENAMRDYQTDRLLKVVDASGGVNTAAIEAAISQVQPDLVCVDATYRIKAPMKAKDRFENLALVTTELKSIAGRHKVPIIGSTQLNRDSTKKKDGEFGTEDLAMSDVLAWEASNIFALFQNEDHKKTNRMAFYPVKVREMEKASKPIVISWNFQNMDFYEMDDFIVAPPSNPVDHF